MLLAGDSSLEQVHSPHPAAFVSSSGRCILQGLFPATIVSRAPKARPGHGCGSARPLEQEASRAVRAPKPCVTLFGGSSACLQPRGTNAQRLVRFASAISSYDYDCLGYYLFHEHKLMRGPTSGRSINPGALLPRHPLSTRLASLFPDFDAFL